MPTTLQSVRPVFLAIFFGIAFALCGCGGGNDSMSAQIPITVSLLSTTVTLSQDGTPVIVRINITSTSETALVAVTGLPSGVGETYAASDTNPSGTLTLKASATTPLGTYMPVVNVGSAGQFASTTFTLIVNATTKTGS